MTFGRYNHNKFATFVLVTAVLSLVFGSAMRSWTPLYDNVYAQTQSPTTTTTKPPNILVIIADDLGF